MVPRLCRWCAAAALTAVALCAPPGQTADQDRPPPLAPIASLDLERYMGTWYEIAKFPNAFQRECIGYTTAQYRLLPDGTVAVINACRHKDGSLEEANGVARQLGPPGSAQLEVRFAPAWLSFVPWVWGDYWVVDIDPEYKLVAVSEPSREYLWVLSRTPRVEHKTYEALLERLMAMGFDVRRLETTRQEQ